MFCVIVMMCYSSLGTEYWTLYNTWIIHVVGCHNQEVLLDLLRRVGRSFLLVRSADTWLAIKSGTCVQLDDGLQWSPKYPPQNYSLGWGLGGLKPCTVSICLKQSWQLESSAAFIACIMSRHTAVPASDGRYVLLQEAERGHDIPRVFTPTPGPLFWEGHRKYRHVPVGKPGSPTGSFPSM